MSHWLHPDAERELGDAAVYYAERASRAIADAFLAEYERTRNLIIRDPLIGKRADAGLRVLRFDRFPDALIYAADAVLGPQIYAVAHQRREPGYWVARR